MLVLYNRVNKLEEKINQDLDLAVNEKLFDAETWARAKRI